MAHEIGHVAACHAAREQTRGHLLNLASIPLIFVGGGLGYAIQSAAGLALPVSFLKFSRNFEAEADYLGVQYLYKAGYDPQAFLSFFEKLEAQEKKKPGFMDKAFSTHPMTPQRVTKAQAEIQSILPPRPEYILDTSEFDEVKARLAAIEGRHRLQDNKGGRPTLRRSTSGDMPPDDDHPPVLRRRDQH
jgi:predicted Zn-dependent protease